MAIAKRQYVTAVIGSLAIGGLVAAAITRHGQPIDAYTWIALAIVVCLGSTLAIRRARWFVFPAVLFFAVYLVFPRSFLRIPFFGYWSLFDDRGGRVGVELTPGIRFGHEGTNTALLESYLGHLPANWWYQSPLSPYIRDGNERVHSRSLIRSERLAEALALLPSEEARIQVLECLADPENRLRVHQGLLLACLESAGYPADYDATTWWARHADLFVKERDPDVSAHTVWGWSNAVAERFPDPTDEVGRQLRAARNHEWASFDRQWDFGDAYRKLTFTKQGLDESDSLPVNVVWWTTGKVEAESHTR